MASQFIFLAAVVAAGWGLALYARRQYRRAKILERERREALSVAATNVPYHYGNYSEAAE
jgi:hypothetical protein